jgi:formylglycine-generating enzyme required for sulfatase activity
MDREDAVSTALSQLVRGIVEARENRFNQIFPRRPVVQEPHPPDFGNQFSFSGDLAVDPCHPLLIRDSPLTTMNVFLRHLLWLPLLTLSASAADIVALCIGNNAYVRPEDQLDTPVNDAVLIANALQSLPGGADVKVLTDASKEDIEIALNSLVQRSRGARLALVFYSGHGMDGQPDGYAAEDTFLLPVEAIIPDVNYLHTRAVPVATVLGALKKAPVTARAVILDCCRTGAPKATSALASTTKNFGDIDERVKAALGKAVVPDATLVAFAASPGRKAAAFLKETDANSPFTAFLAQQFRTGAGNLRDLVETAAETTETATGKRQVPYVSYTGAASAIRSIVFRDVASVTTTLPPMVASAPIPITNNPQPITPPIAAPRAGETKLIGGIEMIWCPPGTFLMGSPAAEALRGTDESQHEVTLSQGFWLAKTECTQAQWAAVMGTSSSEFPGSRLPVENVSWDEAMTWCQRMNTSARDLPPGMKWTLPTEAQWEYACRAGTTTPFSFGTRLNGREANCDGNYPYGTSTKGPFLEKTTEVASYAANAWGFLDTHGNVYEWCSDWYGMDYYESSSDRRDPQGPARGSYRVARGGSWNSNAWSCRSAFRYRNTAGRRSSNLGFRPAVSLP